MKAPRIKEESQEKRQTSYPLAPSAVAATQKVNLIFSDVRKTLDRIGFRVELYREVTVKQLIEATAERLEKEACLSTGKICAAVSSQFCAWGFCDRYVRQVLDQKFKDSNHVKNAKMQRNSKNLAAQTPQSNPDTSRRQARKERKLAQTAFVIVTAENGNDDVHPIGATIMTGNKNGRQGGVVAAIIPASATATKELPPSTTDNCDDVACTAASSHAQHDAPLMLDCITAEDGREMIRFVIRWDEKGQALEALNETRFFCSFYYHKNGEFLKAEPDEPDALESILERMGSALQS